MTDLVVPELSEVDARTLTDQIRAAVEDVWRMIKRAHDGKAYKALGYRSFAAYAQAELDMSLSNAKRLVNHGAVLEALDEMAPMGAISERATRGLPRDEIPAVVDEVREQLAAEPEPTPERRREIIAETVARHRPARPRSAPRTKRADPVPAPVPVVVPPERDDLATEAPRVADDATVAEAAFQYVSARVAYEDHAYVDSDLIAMSRVDVAWSRLRTACGYPVRDSAFGTDWELDPPPAARPVEPTVDIATVNGGCPQDGCVRASDHMGDHDFEAHLTDYRQAHPGPLEQKCRDMIATLPADDPRVQQLQQQLYRGLRNMGIARNIRRRLEAIAADLTVAE